jgi:hypothetical protein
MGILFVDGNQQGDSMSNVVNLSQSKGRAFRRVLTLTDDNGSPIDITNYTFRGQVRRTYLDTSELFSFTFDKTDAVNGEVEMTLASDFYSGQLGANLVCVYDVEWEAPSEDPEELFRGTFTILPTATV